MKPPILQMDWLNRAGFDPDSTANHLETFFLHAVDPKHPRALGLRFTLVTAGKERYGEVQAIFSAAGQHKVATERWPLRRIQVDPERAGVGIGESSVQEGTSVGLVRGDDFVIDWDLQMADELPGFASLPAPWLYRGQAVSPKLSTPHPAGRIRAGKLELWHGFSRHVPLQTVDLSGWRVMQGHRWGSVMPERYAWAHCNTFDEAAEGAYFEVFAGAVRLGALARPQALVGRLYVDGKLYRFDTWRNLFGAPNRFSPTEWTFEMHGPDGTLTGVCRAKPEDTVAMSVPTPEGRAAHAFTNRLASLTLALTPSQGGTRSLTSQKACFEVVQPEPRGAVQSAA